MDQLIYVSDGDLTFRVTEIGDTWIRCKALNTATIGETKNMNIPGAIITLPTLTESVGAHISFERRTSAT